MRMILTQDLTDDTGRLFSLAGVSQSQSIHSEQHSSMDRLESVTHVRKGPGHDYRHGVIDVGTLHLLIDVDLLNPA